jgi:hypothetical protein
VADEIGVFIVGTGVVGGVGSGTLPGTFELVAAVAPDLGAVVGGEPGLPNVLAAVAPATGAALVDIPPKKAVDN